MEIVTLLFFCVILVSFTMLNISVIYALLAGLVIFCVYAVVKKYTLAQIFQMMLFGFSSAKSMLLVFMLIGMLTALWRACGTIPLIICFSARLINPRTVVLTAFLLNCGVSMLTGTSFGTAATMGVICMSMGVSMGVSPVLTGGAVMSGVYFGDRCSPVSTSALLVSELTRTNIYTNVKLMLKTALIPFLISCLVYAAAGIFSTNTGASYDLWRLFGGSFNLHWSVLLPAIIILVLSALRVDVKITMCVSIMASVLICLLVQRLSLYEILGFMATGYRASDLEVDALLNGGGIWPMLQVIIIVCVSSSYAGFFQKTKLLSSVKRLLTKLSERITSFGGTFITSIIAAMVTCSQTLAIILTHQLMKDIEDDTLKLAIDLENTAVIISPLIPWSIAGAIPIATIGAPTQSLLAAVFLYLLPLYTFAIAITQKKRPEGRSV